MVDEARELGRRIVFDFRAAQLGDPIFAAAVGEDTGVVYYLELYLVGQQVGRIYSAKDCETLIGLGMEYTRTLIIDQVAPRCFLLFPPLS